MSFIENAMGGKRNVFIVVFLLITAILAGGAYALLVFINGVVRSPDINEELAQLSPIYVNFYTDNEEYVSEESYLAMGAYAQEHPLPQNVQVLEGMATHEINGYMLNHFVGGLRVNCTFCHSLENFALEEWGDTPEINEAEHNRWVAREHLKMSQDLNQNWLTILPGLSDQKQPSGSQITCATCHNGAPGDAEFMVRAGRGTLPADFQVPVGPDVVYSTDEDGYLNVTGKTIEDGLSLDATQMNQYVMYHMNSALNVGCTHCHNSRWFPSNEVPAKHYSMQMLQMTQYISNEWGHVLIANPGEEPGVAQCTTCHREAAIPHGSARSVDVLAPALVPEGSQSENVSWGDWQDSEERTAEWYATAEENNVYDDPGYNYDPNDPANSYEPGALEAAMATDSE